MSYKVIVADDSPSARKAAELALVGPEFETYAFDDGLETIEAIPDIRPDAVLVSISLPSRDGYEVAGFVRAQEGGRHVAFFLLQGTFEALDVGKSAKADHDGIIPKPFDGGTLSGLVRDTIDRKKVLPSLPEEPVLEAPAPNAVPVEPAAPTPPGLPEWSEELELKIRAVVREEIWENQSDLRTIAREVVSAEFKKMLVAELKNIDTGKI